MRTGRAGAGAGRAGQRGEASAGCSRVSSLARWRVGSVGTCGCPCGPGRGRVRAGKHRCGAWVAAGWPCLPWVAVE